MHDIQKIGEEFKAAMDKEMEGLRTTMADHWYNSWLEMRGKRDFWCAVSVFLLCALVGFALHAFFSR